MVADHLHLDRIAQVGLVGAVFQQGFRIGDARPVGIDAAPAAELLEQALDDRLDRGKDVLLADKGHLHVQLIEIGRAAVGARVFVAETGRDLEIPVETRNHDQLLELLGRLRQGIELARVQARGHQEIACALGGRRGDDRGLELGEALVPHAVADRPDHPRPQHDVVVQGLAAQVQKAEGEARLLGVILIAEDRQRQFVRGTQHLDFGRIDLDLAGGQLGVDQRRVAQLDPSVNAHHGFRAQPVHRGECRAVAVGQHLRHAVMVAQIHEQHAAVVADPVHPARQADGGPGIGGLQVAAGMAAIGVHVRFPQIFSPRTKRGPGGKSTSQNGRTTLPL